MKQLITLFSLLLFAAGSMVKANDTVQIDINFDVNHIVGNIDSFDRQKFVTIHASPTENDWTQTGMTTDYMDYLFEDLGVYFGRDNGRLGSEVRWFLQQDATRPGYVSPSSISTRGATFKSEYNTKPIWNRYDDKNDVMMGGQVNGMWHTPTGTTWDWAGPDAVGEYLARWVAGAHRPIGDNNKANGMPMNRFVEILNEPLYHFVDDATIDESEKEDPITVFRFHRDVANAFHNQNTTGAKIGGFTTAFPYFTDDEFQRWDKRMKLFMDSAGSAMDFYSIHIYDFNKHHDGTHRHFKGSRVEATFDLIENYSMLIDNEVKPFVISEYGGRDLKEEYKTWSAERDWKYMKAFTPLLMSFMDRPDIMLKTIPFIPANYYWYQTYNPGKNPYPWRLFRRSGEPASNDGDYVFTELIKFYELWDDINGKRIDTWSVNADVLVDGYVENNTAYIILSNVGFEEEPIKLNLNGLNGNTITGVMLKHLHSVNELPKLDTLQVSELDSFTLDPEASAVIKYTFASNVTVDKNSLETRYYSDKVKQEIKANTPVTFNVNNVVTDTYGSAILRVSFGRADSLAKQPIVKINGDSLIVPMNFSGDDVVSSYPWFYGLLEIPVPYRLLSANNTVTVEFPDAGGYISAVTMKVFNNDRSIVRSDSVQSVSIYPASLSLGIDQFRQLTAAVLPTYAQDKRVEWKSSDESKVTVDANGKLQGKAVGSAIITATSVNGIVANCNVTIESSRVPVLVDTVIVKPATAELIETKTIQLSYEILPVDADDKSIIWSTSNSNATVADGLVTAISEGNVDIIASGANNKGGFSSFDIIKRIPGVIELIDESSYEIIQEGTSFTVVCNYFTTTGETLTGLRFSLEVVDGDSNLIKLYNAYDNAKIGSTSGTSTVTIGSRRTVASANLPAGQYYVLNIVMTESDGNEIIKSMRVTVGEPNSAEDNIAESLLIYPNPAKDILNISGLLADKTYVVSVITMQGIVLFNDLINYSVDKQINISDLPEGVYMLSVSGENINKTLLLKK